VELKFLWYFTKKKKDLTGCLLLDLMKLKDWERNLHNTLQGEINMARSQKQDLTCIAFFKENETRFLKGIHFE